MKQIRFLIVWMIAGVLLIGTPAISQTWTSLEGPFQPRDVRDIATDSTGTVLYACDKTFLFKSTNGGLSWAKTTVEFPSPLVVVCKPDNPDVVVVGVTGTIFLNTTGGSSGIWEPKLTGAGTPLRLAVSAVNSSNMYLGRQHSSNTSPICYGRFGGAEWFPSYFSEPETTSIYDIAAYPTTGIRRGDAWAGGSDPNGAAEGIAKPGRRGVWFSPDSGRTWYQRGLNQYDIHAIAIQRIEGDTIFAGTSRGRVFRRAYLSETWEATQSLGASVTTIRALRIRNNSEVYAATNAGIFRSTNGGRGWSNLMPNGDNNILAFNIARDNQNLMYATTANTVWKSTNGGFDWIPINNGLGRMPVSSVAVSGNNIRTVSKQYPDVGRFDGTTWSKFTIPHFKGEHITPKPNRVDTIFATGLLGQGSSQKAALYRSTDGGVSCSSLYSTAPEGVGNIFKGTTFNTLNNSIVYVYGKDGATANFYFITENGTGPREPIIVGSPEFKTVNDVAVLNISNTLILYYGLDSIGVFKSVGGPSKGNQTGLTGETIVSLGINPNRPNIIYAGGPNGLWRSTNSGDNWLQIIRGRSIKKVLVPTSTAKGADEVVVIATGASGDTVFRSVFPAQSHSYTDITGNLPKPVSNIGVRSANPKFYYVATDQGVFQSPDFHPAAPLLTRISDTTINNRKRPRFRWRSGDADIKNYKLYRYACSYGAGDCEGYATNIATTADTAYTDMEVEVFTVQKPLIIEPYYTYWYYVVAVDSGNNNSSISNKVTVDSNSPPGENPAKTLAENAGEENLPTNFALEPNYPNPFNPKTLIRYALPEDVHVTLKVYDVLGREVAVLVDEFQAASFKSVEFDASNLPSGVYYYRLSAGLFTDIKKMMVVK